jgi:hypothetical protein
MNQKFKGTLCLSIIRFESPVLGLEFGSKFDIDLFRAANFNSFRLRRAEIALQKVQQRA